MEKLNELADFLDIQINRLNQIKSKNKMKTIKEIVDQLSMSEYECEGGYLKNNIAFERLKEIAKSNYQPKFHLNEKVVYNGKEYFVRGVITADCSHPHAEVKYMFSAEWNRPSTTNKTDESSVDERLIYSFDEWEKQQIEAAKKFLASKGIKIN